MCLYERVRPELPFDLRHLQAFQAAVAGGSLTAGADALHVSQPALSATIAGLERRVGVPLLVRTARGVTPTAAGRYLLDASSRIVGAAEETARALAGFGDGTRGSLTVAAVPALLSRQVPEILAAFAAEAPDVEITLLALPPWQAIDLVERGGADIALVLATATGAFARRAEGGPIVVDGPAVPLRLALPASDGDGDAVVPASALAARVLLVPRRTAALPSLPEAVEDYLRATGVTPRAVRTVDTIQTTFPLVAAGHGVALAPDTAVGVTSGVALRRLDPEPDPLRLYGLHRAGPIPPGAARLLGILSASA